MTDITPLNDGWQDREDATAPLDRVVTEHGGQIGAVVEIIRYVPPAPIALEAQHDWGALLRR